MDAATGSGKTLAFLLPVIERLRRLEEPLRKHQVGAMVIAPTRELAGQIHEVAQPLVASVPGLSSQLLVGGRYAVAFHWLIIFAWCWNAQQPGGRRGVATESRRQPAHWHPR